MSANDVSRDKSTPAKPGFLKKVLLFATLAFAVILTIVVLQNTDSVRTRILFVTIVMPQALLLFLTLLIGFSAGIVVSILMMRHRSRKRRGDIGRTP